MFVPKTAIDPLVGQVVDDRYLVRELIAKGGMATVYLATDRRLGRDVALKIMRPALAGEGTTSDFISRFRREARAAARLTHPGMVRVYDQGTDGDTSYLTMEYIEGDNLRQRLEQEATIPVGEALQITEAILGALGAAHALGLVHRDVKPENILIDADGNPKIADFGLARAVTDITATTTGTIMGTVAYLGPELVQRGESDARTDVYAIGILLYEMVTGRQPFTGESAIDIAHRHVQENIPPPSAHVPWLPPEFDALVSELAARDPDARPSDANQALTAVRRARTMIDDPTLDRRADPPTGSFPVSTHTAQTQVLDPTPTGSTVALPIGLGLEFEAEDEEDLDPTTSSQITTAPNRLAWWVGAIAAAIVALALMGVWWYSAIGPGAYTQIPDVAGRTVEEATTALEAEGLTVAVNQKYNDEVPVGSVVGTDPPAEEEVINAGTVTVIVSRGPMMTDIPVVATILESDALERLSDAGFPAPNVSRAYSDTVPVGEVISSEPAAGERVRHDTVIDLLISDGPEPIRIPNVFNAAEGTALAALEGFALDVTVVRGRTDLVDEGHVYDQDPASGTAGLRTQEMVIYVSIGLPLVDVPNFTGLNEALAIARAEDEGLLVTVTNVPWESCAPLTICGQSVAPGEEVEIGSTIHLWY